MFFRWYEAGLRAETPAVPAPGYKWSQLPTLNQAIYEEYRDLPLEEVLSLFRESHQKTVKLIESLSESDLTIPGLYKWMNQNALMVYINANTGSHYRWAVTNILPNEDRRTDKVSFRKSFSVMTCTFCRMIDDQKRSLMGAFFEYHSSIIFSREVCGLTLASL
jgi:hypothetical protein